MNRLNLLLSFIVLLLAMLYLPLNTPRYPLHYLKVPIDNLIPLIPIFIIPYLSYYIFPVMVMVHLAFFKKKYATDLSIALLAATLTFIISYFFFVLFQTTIERPTVLGTDPFSQLLKWLYAIDQPFNAFPSLHTSLSMIGIIALLRVAKIKSMHSPWIIAWGISIIFSTVLVKQHYIVDVFGGIMVAIFSYFISYYILFPKQKFLES